MLEQNSAEQGTLVSRQEATRDYAYYKSVFDGYQMPFAYLDLDLLEQNISSIVANAGDKKVRLASKSLRSVSVIKRILAASPIFQGVMSFTALEAVYLASQGIDDLLIGYPTWHAEDISAVARATAEGAHITLMIDSVEHVEQVERIASEHGVRLPLCLDIDMATQFPGLHFGVWRSTLRTPEQTRPVIERVLTSPHVWLDGLMGYEAQIAGVGDNIAGQALKSLLVRQLKRSSVRDVVARRTALVELIASSRRLCHRDRASSITSALHLSWWWLYRFRWHRTRKAAAPLFTRRCQLRLHRGSGRGANAHSL